MFTHEQTQWFFFLSVVHAWLRSDVRIKRQAQSSGHQLCAIRFRSSKHIPREATERRATQLLLRLISANVYSDGVNHISFAAFTSWFLDVQRRDQNSHRAQTPQ